jgi:hypothetical protein
MLMYTMNSGYNPALSTPSLIAKKQMATNTVPFYQGGSQVESALGFTPMIAETKPKNIILKKISKK